MMRIPNVSKFSSLYSVSIQDSKHEGYAGDVTPAEAWRLLQCNENASVFLIDVRTQAEWTVVGVPDLSHISQTSLFIEWQIFPDMSLNKDFMNMLNASVNNQDACLLFLCRSGKRSISAAQAAQSVGYYSAYNIMGGFEGDCDHKGHRGTVNGWKVDALPWRQN